MGEETDAHRCAWPTQQATTNIICWKVERSQTVTEQGKERCWGRERERESQEYMTAENVDMLEIKFIFNFV